MPALRSLASTAEALLTPHGMDHYLELVNPMVVRREIRSEIREVRRQTADTVTLTISPSRAWRGFTAGQYVRITVDIDGVRRTRCYSPACSEHTTPVACWNSPSSATGSFPGSCTTTRGPG